MCLKRVLPGLFLAMLFLSLLATCRLKGGEVHPDSPTASSFDPLAVPLDHFRNLEYDAAQQELEAWLQKHPADLRAQSYLATTILYREMFRRGVLQQQVFGDLSGVFQGSPTEVSPAFQNKLLGILGRTQQQAQQRLEKNPNDQEALYWDGVSHGTQAIYDFTILKSYLAALRESTAARRDHQRLLQINPGYTDALLILGLNDYIAGSLPWYYKIMAALTGYHGSRARGLDELRQVARHGHWARDDARFVLTVLYRREKMYPETIEVLRGLAESFPRNFLILHELANLYELQGNWRAASNILDEMVRKNTAGDTGYTSLPVNKLLYEAARAHARLGETEQARRDFEKVTKVSPNSEEGRAALRALQALP